LREKHKSIIRPEQEDHSRIIKGTIQSFPMVCSQVRLSLMGKNLLLLQDISYKLSDKLYRGGKIRQ